MLVVESSCALPAAAVLKVCARFGSCGVGVGGGGEIGDCVVQSGVRFCGNRCCGAHFRGWNDERDWRLERLGMEVRGCWGDELGFLGRWEIWRQHSLKEQRDETALSRFDADWCEDES